MWDLSKTALGELVTMLHGVDSERAVIVRGLRGSLLLLSSARCGFGSRAQGCWVAYAVLAWSGLRRLWFCWTVTALLLG